MRRYLVIQMGARMGYAVPAILAQAGMLAELWTDLHAGDWPARLLGTLPDKLRGRAVRSLLGRELPPAIPRTAVRSFPWRTLWARARQQYLDHSIQHLLLERGFNGANAVYSLMFGDAEVLQAAKGTGLFVAFEQVSNIEDPDIVRKERELFPGIEGQEPMENDDFYVRTHRRVWQIADVILSPSDYVTCGIRRLGGDTATVQLVPYAVSEHWFQLVPRFQRGRVLCAASVCLRKGIHYLAAAARILRRRGVPCDVRVAGPFAPGLVDRDLFQGLTYLGRVPRSEMNLEFLSADIFVLPTLSEGSALSHIEALACGLPVITTPNCGTMIRDGVEGFIVPVRDAEAIAERIELLIANRELRQEMSASARALARREHTWPRYGERLLEALSTTQSPQPSSSTR